MHRCKGQLKDQLHIRSPKFSKASKLTSRRNFSYLKIVNSASESNHVVSTLSCISDGVVQYAVYNCGYHIYKVRFLDICNGCNMAMRDLPDMYAQSSRAAGPRAEGIHIRQMTNGHVTNIMYHFVPIVTTPVV